MDLTAYPDPHIPENYKKQVYLLEIYETETLLFSRNI